jgi:hypothetical protein
MFILSKFFVYLILSTYASFLKTNMELEKSKNHGYCYCELLAIGVPKNQSCKDGSDCIASYKGRAIRGVPPKWLNCFFGNILFGSFGLT